MQLRGIDPIRINFGPVKNGRFLTFLDPENFRGNFCSLVREGKFFFFTNPKFVAGSILAPFFGRVKKTNFALDSESGPVLVFFWRFRAENSEKVGFGTPGPQDTVFHPWPRMAQIVRISANLSLCVEISANEADCD